MLNAVLIILLGGVGDFNVPIDDLGFYEPGIKVHKYNDYFLFSSSLEGGIALVDNLGKIHKKYQKKGLGPGELHFPYVLGLSDQIIIVSNFKNIITFDQNLTPKSGTYPSLPIEVASGSTILHGFSLKENRFLLIQKAWSARTHSIYELEFDNGKWQEGAAFFPQNNPPNSPWQEKMRNNNFNFHNGLIFKTEAVADDWYEVSIFPPPLKKGDDDEMVQTLVGNLEGFPVLKPGYRAYICESFKTEFGYVVTFQINFLPEGKGPKYMADLFDQQGKFLKRVSLESNAIPCVNCEEVLIEGETADGKEVFKQLKFTWE